MCSNYNTWCVLYNRSQMAVSASGIKIRAIFRLGKTSRYDSVATNTFSNRDCDDFFLTHALSVIAPFKFLGHVGTMCSFLPRATKKYFLRQRVMVHVSRCMYMGFNLSVLVGLGSCGALTSSCWTTYAVARFTVWKVLSCWQFRMNALFQRRCVAQR